MKTKFISIITLLFATFFSASAGTEVKKQEPPKVRAVTVEKTKFRLPFRSPIVKERQTQFVPVAPRVQTVPRTQAAKPCPPDSKKKSSDPLVTMKASTKAWYVKQYEIKKKLECNISDLKAKLAQSGIDKSLVADLKTKLAQASSAGESLIAENKNLHSRITELEQELCEVNARLSEVLATPAVLSESTEDESPKFETIEALLRELAGVGKVHEEKIAQIDSRTASLEVCAVTRDDRISAIEDFLYKAFSDEEAEVETTPEVLSGAPEVSVEANQNVSVVVNPAELAPSEPTTTIRRTMIRRLSTAEVVRSADSAPSEEVYVDWGIKRL